MVVNPTRVAADATARHAILRLAVVAAPVGDADGEDRQGIVHQRLRVARRRGALGREPIHSGQMAGVDAVAQNAEDLGERLSTRHRRNREAVRESERFDPACQPLAGSSGEDGASVAGTPSSSSMSCGEYLPAGWFETTVAPSIQKARSLHAERCAILIGSDWHGAEFVASPGYEAPAADREGLFSIREGMRRVLARGRRRDRDPSLPCSRSIGPSSHHSDPGRGPGRPLAAGRDLPADARRVGTPLGSGLVAFH